MSTQETVFSPVTSKIKDYQAQIDLVRLRRHRLTRLREQLSAMDCGAALLFDPLNLRYATGSRNMQVFMQRNPARYAFVPVDGPITLFDFPNCEGLSAGLETIDEVRPAITMSFPASGNRVEEKANEWAAEIAQLVRERGGGSRRLAIDCIPYSGAFALVDLGVDIADGQRAVELARAIKSEEEIDCIKLSLAVAEAGMTRMREILRPGITENELWALLHHTNIALGGEYVETRLLSSGERTNPWFQECSDRQIAAGDLVAFDTDMVGPLGYYADVSRTFYCGEQEPTGEQTRLYQIAYQHVQENISLLKPGLTFHGFSQRSSQLPSEFTANRYFVVAHGSGLSGEYPYIVYPQDYAEKGYDGVIEENMVLSVESYVGAVGGREGVKLEEMVVVRRDGAEVLSSFPFESSLLE